MDRIGLLARELEQNNIAAQQKIPLSQKCTFRIGGPADLFAEPKSGDEITTALALAAKHGVPMLVLGAGSNILFADEGYRGFILKLGVGFSRVWQESEAVISCQSGAKLSELCEFARQLGLAGLEFAYGIPGTVGGAVYMNAGAFGGEIADVITGAQFISSDGKMTEYKAQEMDFDYRRSFFMDMSGVITQASFNLTPGDPQEIRARMDDYMNRRRDKQPLEYPSAGSTFKRPPGNYASALIDQCGLKGLRVGGAAVSEKHAGFVVNMGGATCKDVLALIEQVKTQVSAQTGYKLECEVQVV